MKRALVILAVVVAGVAIALFVSTRRPPAPVPALDAARSTAIAQTPTIDAQPIARDATVIDAASIAARDERDHVLAGLVDSGSGAEAWDAQATAVLDSLAQHGAVITNSACYVAGCGATVTFPSEAEYRRRIAELESSDAYRAWTGGKRLTSPELATDGRVTIAIALYRPD